MSGDHEEKAERPPRNRGEILCIGEAIIDVVEENLTRVEHVGGSPANVAVGLARLGHNVSLLTHLATDERAKLVANYLRDNKVAVIDGSFTAERTGTATVSLRPDGSAEYDFDISWAPDASAASTLIETVDVVHTGSIAAFLAPGSATVLDIIAQAAEDGTIVTFDPNIRPALIGTHRAARERVGELAALSHVVKLSDEDAAWLYPNEPLDQVASQLLSQGPHLVAITLGSDGALVASGGGMVRARAPRVQVADTIGAGDSFMSAVVAKIATQAQQHGVDTVSWMLNDNDRTAQVADFAVRCAAITVSRHGAELPNLADLSIASV